MDLNTPNTDVNIAGTETDEVRANANDIRVTVTETGRVLGGFVFTVGGSRLTINDGGVVQRGSGGFGSTEIAITGSFGVDTVINNGAINGRVTLGDGNDWFNSTRGVSGLVEMGAGDDLVTLLGSNITQINLDGGSGFDWLQIGNSSFGASGQLTATNFEGLRLDGASAGGNTDGVPRTSIWNITGLQRIEIQGEVNPDPFVSMPQFYIGESAVAGASVSIAARAALYLQNTQVRSVTGDSFTNVLSLWGNASVAENVSLGGGDDFLSVEWQSTNVTSAGLGNSVSGGSGQDQAYFRLANGGTAAINLALFTGFETILLQGSSTVASTFNVSGLSDQTKLRIADQANVNLTATNAFSLVTELAASSLTLAAGSLIRQVGQDLFSYSNPNPNPSLSSNVVNAGTILGTVRFEQGDDTYDGRTGSVGGIVSGMAGNDTLLGGSGAEIFRGGLGADRLEGNGGADVLFGDEGGDTLLGGDGNDQLFGGAGGDVLDGGAGFDFASYSAAPGGIIADLAAWSSNTGEAAGDSYAEIEGLVGTAFDDNLRGTGGDNWLYGGAGNDVAFGRAGNDVLVGEAGDDTLYGNEGNDWLYGGDGLDRLLGGTGADYLNGEAGFDFAHYDDAASGVAIDLVNNAANGGAAAGDLLFNIEGLVGSAFADRLVGSDDGNWLYGNDGQDALFGRGGNDVLIAGNGDDQLNGGAGADQLYGDAGFDFARYDDAASAVTVSLLANAANAGAAAGDLLFGIEGLVGSAFGDTLIGSDETNWLYGNDGQDALFGRGGDDVLIGGAGDDQLIGGAGADQLYGDAGLDFARYDSTASGLVADLIAWVNNTGEAAGDTYSGVEGLVGTAFGDSLRGDSAANYLYGELGDDWLYGRDGDDTLLGGNGNDFLFGNAGRDLLFGGGGNDRFFIGAGDGTDVIADFESGGGTVIDTIHIGPGLGVTSFAQLQSRTSQVGNDTVITFDDGTALVLIGVSSTILLADDFVFG